MLIPSEETKRKLFYLDLIDKCLFSRETRKSDYTSLRSYYLFGSNPNESPSLFNKIYPHIDQLASFLYSAETTRFSIDIGASIHTIENKKVPVLTKAVNDEWLNSNADQVFSLGLNWSLVYNSTFIKLIYNKGIHPYMVEPGCIGVLREDSPYTDRQEALVQTYYITKSELYNRLYSHNQRDKIIKAIVSGIHSRTSDIPEGVERIVMSQTNPTLYGNVNLELSGLNRYKALVAEDTVEMKELWVWNDKTRDYQVVTIADPGVVIYDRAGEDVFLKGELPFIQICPSPQYDYYWGRSEVQALVLLQELRNRRMTEILNLLSLQVDPPTALSGFTGILDEKKFSFNRAGSLLTSDMPNAKVEQFAPKMPTDLFEVIREIDEMFSEASGISNVLSGRGEQGVRSSGHASQLARLGSSRAKKRALVVEDALEKLATLYLKVMQKYDRTHFRDEDGQEFIAEQFTKDFVVKVDAHSNSPIFSEDLRTLAFELRDRDAISNESLLDLVEPPMKNLLKERLAKHEKEKAAVAAAQPPDQPNK